MSALPWIIAAVAIVGLFILGRQVRDERRRADALIHDVLRLMDEYGDSVLEQHGTHRPVNESATQHGAPLDPARNIFAGQPLDVTAKWPGAGIHNTDTEAHR